MAPDDWLEEARYHGPAPVINRSQFSPGRAPGAMAEDPLVLVWYRDYTVHGADWVEEMVPRSQLPGPVG